MEEVTGSLSSGSLSSGSLSSGSLSSGTPAVASSRQPAAFSKSKRILRRSEFTLVQRSGLPARCTCGLVLVHHESSGSDRPARLGIIASRKVGNAVERNRAKRLIREWFRHVILPVGLEVVVVAAASIQGATADLVARDLTVALERARAKTRRGLKPKGAASKTVADEAG